MYIIIIYIILWNLINFRHFIFTSSKYVRFFYSSTIIPPFRSIDIYSEGTEVFIILRRVSFPQTRRNTSFVEIVSNEFESVVEIRSHRVAPISKGDQIVR